MQITTLTGEDDASPVLNLFQDLL